mgnify:CR=1 FL=1
MKVYWAIYAKLKNLKLGLSHEDDVDGIVSASLFLRKFPNSVLILGQPSEIKDSIFCWYNWITWDFVADLPCPARVKVYADHHKTNKPKRVEVLYYNPQAPSAASLTIIALGLEGDKISEEIVKVANDADTGRYSLEESILLNDAIKGADYHGKLYIAREMSKIGLEVLKNPRINKWIEINRRRRERASLIAERIETSPILIVEFERDVDIPYRDLCLKLERKGANELCAIIVPKGRRWRIYLGASRESSYDCSLLATKLGGGGHKSAAGAMVKDKQRIYALLKDFLNTDKIKVVLVKNKNNINTLEV